MSFFGEEGRESRWSEHGVYVAGQAAAGDGGLRSCRGRAFYVVHSILGAEFDEWEENLGPTSK
jgi:hypothetical protein